MRYRREPDVVYRNGFVVAVGGAIAAGWTIALFVVGWGLLVVYLPVVPFVTYFGVIRPRVVLSDSEVRIVGPLGEEVVRYEQIQDVRFTGKLLGYRYLQIHGPAGWVTDLVGPFGSVVPFTDPLWQRPLQEELLRRAGEARAAGDPS